MRRNFYLITLLLMAFSTSVNAFETEVPDLKIVADGIDNTGIASATRGYSFRADIPMGLIIFM